MSAQLGSFLPERETQSELLRASVVEAAMTLGPKVTKLMFADSLYKHRREQGSSSGSSFDGVLFYDEYSTTGSDSSSNISVIPEESEENFNENFDSKTVLINDDFGSHFVLVPKNKEPLQSLPEDIPSEQPNIKPLKKGVNFAFLSRKSTKKVEFAQTKKQPSISHPRRLFPALDDPVAPTFITPPANKARSDVSNSPRTTPTKLRKRVQVESDDWDFKDPDRPSFFFDQIPELLKDGGERKLQDADVDVDDRGYLSEGTGLSHKHTSFRRKKKNTNPYIDWGEKLVSGNRNGSKANLRQNIPAPSVPNTPVSLPVADRFIRKSPPPQTETERVKTPPEADVVSFDNKLLVLPAKPPHQLTATPISDLSFIMMPDLNVAKRLHLDRYASEASGVIGADNVIKLQMMEKLLKQKDIRVLKEKPSAAPHPLSKPPAMVDQPVPEIEVTSPSRTPIEPINDDITPTPIRGKDAPFPKRQETRSPGPIVRGREPAFPTKPIRRNNVSPHSSVSPLRLRAPPPDRYRDIDVPRSVRSSYEKDLVREEEGTESLLVRGRRTDNGSIGTRSVYSQR